MARSGKLGEVVLDRDFQVKAAALGVVPLAAGATLVLAAARREMPQSADGSNGHPAGYAQSRMQILGKGPGYIDVGTDAVSPEGASYPAIVHYGSRPHTISSHGNYPLRDRHGRVFGRTVSHPGTKPNPWAERAAMAINGMRLSS